MTADEYLNMLLVREAVNTSTTSPVLTVQATLMPIFREWAGSQLLTVHPSGSFMKGTAILSGTDIDLFISLSETTKESLKEIHALLFTKLTKAGYAPMRQNVSLNIKVRGYSVDLVPAKRQNPLLNDHSLYRRNGGEWTKTNVVTHINYVRAANCQQETRILKLWRNQKKLDFPSFYLELTVIKALSLQIGYTLERRVQIVFEYLRDSFAAARVVDPANSNNVISDDVIAGEKLKIIAAAKAARNATNWNEIVK